MLFYLVNNIVGISVAVMFPICIITNIGIVFFPLQTDDAVHADSNKRNLPSEQSPKKKKVKTFDVNLESAPSDGRFCLVLSLK